MAKLIDKFFNRIIEGTLELGEDEKIKGNLELEPSGKAKIFENIVDKDEHKRFIEGNGVVSPISGLSNTYCKWALSGTHLLLVCAGKLADETAIANGTVLCEFTLPEWAFDKIYPVWGNAYIEYKEIDLRADNWIGQTLGVALYKGADNKVGFIIPNNITLTDNRAFRIEFDLLIDNE